MLENFVGLRIKGRCFENETTLEFFPKNNAKTKDNRVALVFGRNGAGKSTVTRVFEGLSKGQTETISGMETPKIIGDIYCDDIQPLIAIFNEDYVLSKIKLKEGEKGLSTIVFLGDQAEYSEDLWSAEKEINDIDAQFSLFLKKINETFGMQLSITGPVPYSYLTRNLNTLLHNFLAHTYWQKRETMIRADEGKVPITFELTEGLLKSSECSNPIAAQRQFDNMLIALKKLLSDYASHRGSKKVKKNIDNLKDQLKSLNFQLTRHELGVEFNNKIESYREAFEAFQKLHPLYLRRHLATTRIEKLRRKVKQVKIASKRINAALAYMFMSKKRIQLVLEDGFYTIRSNGHSVTPRDISIGERNALALAYFFSDIMRGKFVNQLKKTEKLIILDDPVSSFDHENKMGVLSYIMHEIENLKSSRFICLMHDMYSFTSLASSINAHDKPAMNTEPIGLTTFMLNIKKGGLIEKNTSSMNEYRFNFEEVYGYAKLEEPDEENIHVGNQMRRILEAYSTFVYRKGFEYLFYGELIRGENAELYNSYYKAVFTRFIMNDDSHTEGKVRSLTDMNSMLPFLTPHIRHQAIRDSICLLYLINPDHVLSIYDKTKKDEKQKYEALKLDIEKWLMDIRENAPAIGVSKL